MAAAQEHRGRCPGSRPWELLQLPDDALVHVLRSLPLHERLENQPGAWFEPAGGADRPALPWLHFQRFSEVLPEDVAAPEEALQGVKPHTALSAYCAALGVMLGDLVQLTRLELQGDSRSHVLPELPLSQHLELHCIGGRAPAAAYAALTASTNLQALEIGSCCLPERMQRGTCLRRAAAAAAAELRINYSGWGSCFEECWRGSDAALRFDSGMASNAHCLVLSSQELALLVACCPGLQELSSVCLRPCRHSDCLASCSSLQPLQQLPRLEQLLICGPWGGGPGGSSSGPEQVLRRLSGLSQLTVLSNPRFTSGSLAHLTCLTQLRRLVVRRCPTCFEDAPVSPADSQDAGAQGGAGSEDDAEAHDAQSVRSHRKDVILLDPYTVPVSSLSGLRRAVRVLHTHAQQQLQEQGQQLDAVQDQLAAALQCMETRNARLQQQEEQLAAAADRIATLERQLAQQEQQR
ncbi:hypothetical protein COO60DRAFT_1635942 [Scenedesmus sp. NREL 46B-D3]|nr:hypothetical protein COO60DRAFT_1635942 [Scenedesmus sp. NREL 46B-D3]